MSAGSREAAGAGPRGAAAACLGAVPWAADAASAAAVMARPTANARRLRRAARGKKRRRLPARIGGKSGTAQRGGVYGSGEGGVMKGAGEGEEDMTNHRLG